MKWQERRVRKKSSRAIFYEANTLTVAAMKEHMAELYGVLVEETIRKYKDVDKRIGL